MSHETHVITGAFGYSGKYIARLLLQKGIAVRTLTSKAPPAHGELANIETHPFRFDDINVMVESMSGARVLYNTYWVRFDHGDRSHRGAVENSKKLIAAAKQAGVERIVHISITNPDQNSSLPYFSGKAELEKSVKESGMSYAILRPTVLFGREDILVNNIAWLLRRFPIFGVFGDGNYRIQPVFAGDLADLAVRQAFETSNIVLDAVGPETFSFNEFVSVIRNAIGSRAKILSIPPRLAYAIGAIIGRIVGDVVVTKDEIQGLTAGLLVSNEKPTCPTLFSEWLKENGEFLGRKYANEIARHFG